MNNFEHHDKAQDLVVSTTHYGVARLLVEAKELLECAKSRCPSDKTLLGKIDEFLEGGDI